MRDPDLIGVAEARACPRNLLVPRSDLLGWLFSGLAVARSERRTWTLESHRPLHVGQGVHLGIEPALHLAQLVPEAVERVVAASNLVAELVALGAEGDLVGALALSPATYLCSPDGTG